MLQTPASMGGDGLATSTTSTAAPTSYTDILDVVFPGQTVEDIDALGNGTFTRWGADVTLSDTGIGDADITADGLVLGIAANDAAPFLTWDLDALGLTDSDLFRIIVELESITFGQVGDRLRMEITDSAGGGATKLEGCNYDRYASTSYRGEALQVGPNDSHSETSGTASPSTRVHLELRGCSGFVRCLIGRDLDAGIPAPEDMTAFAQIGVLNGTEGAVDDLQRYLNLTLHGTGVSASTVTVKRLTIRRFR